MTALLMSACGGPVDPEALQPASTPRSATKPSALTVAAGPTCIGSGAHAKHQSAGLDCVVCHPCGGQFGFTSAVTYPGGTTSAQGTITLATATTPTTCSVGCHSPLGSPGHTVAWTAPGPLACTACHAASSLVPQHPAVSDSMTRADCQACHNISNHTSGTVTLVGHPTTWMTQSDPGFHAYSADRGLASCQACHLQDLSGGLTGFSCGQCHDQKDASGTVVVGWKTNCTMCHGGTDNQTGAPPRTIWGYDADAVRVGAHTTHITGSGIAPAFDCGVCHVKPADALAAGHIDTVTGTSVPTATVAFSGIASTGVTQAPTWDRGSATCSATYCHGATLGGGTNTMPIWTLVGQGQAACGTCHGVPPPAPHPAITGGLAACNPCHLATIDPAGNLIPPSSGGKHLNGVLDVSGHGAGWMDQTSTGFHAYSANRGISGCETCHGADLSGGIVGVACAQCHGGGWPTNCTMCHGGTDNRSGAPPRPTWGNTNPLAVGAHTSHVAGTHGVAPPIDCTACHAKPADALTVGHVDGAVSVTRYTGTNTALLAVAGDPGWSEATGKCSAAYCHGATLTGGTNRQPTWTTVDGSQAACGTCHGSPPGSPPSPQHPTYLFAAPCIGCHPLTATVDGTGKNAIVQGGGLHVNGQVEYTFTGHSPGWADSWGGDHSAEAPMGSGGIGGISMQQYYDVCTPCHGKNGDFEPTGGTSRVSCGACHPAFFGANGKTNCWGFCH